MSRKEHGLPAQAGFTLIELLVVIAIIGILASVVLSALNSARGKGQDAKVKEQLSSVKNAAAIFADDNNQSYGPVSVVCDGSDAVGSMWADSNSGMSKYTDIANYTGLVAGDLACDSQGTTWAMSAKLPGASTGGTDTFWCVDSEGSAIQTTTSPAIDASTDLCVTS